ncbi:transforming growth factor beta-2 proprotein-like isoform X2 [Antedon mediterranea]|uniref:transforming growth factor beta-2 proprotein-like isoform X2 n=1 Tax=Antedon mediterranea TaxID=105859 RepID=UPI003AF5BC0B
MDLFTFLNYSLRSMNIFGKTRRRTMSLTVYLFALVFVISIEICSSSQCMLDIYQYETKRTAAIRGQILSKLGMTVPPKDTGPAIIPKDDEEKWNETQRILEEQWLEKLESCHDSINEDEYYAKLTKTYSLEKEWPQISNNEDFKTYYSDNRVKNKYSMFYKFNVSDLQRMAKSIEITKAELRIFKANKSEATVSEQHIELYAIEGMNGTNSPLRKFVGAKVVNTDDDEWLSFDVKDAIQRSITTCKDYGFELTTHCDPFQDRQPLQFLLAGPYQQVPVTDRGDSPHDDESTAQMFIKSGSYPTLIVFYIASPSSMSGSIEETSVQMNLSPGAQHDESGTDQHRRRTRRSERQRRAAELDEDFCDYENSKRCCLREFYIDFEKHLNWRWIRRPRGYRANFCAGSCPYMWGTDVMNTQVIGLYKKMNPDASPSPCCVSKKLKPLSILYYEGNKPVVTTLSDMITTSCKCS